MASRDQGQRAWNINIPYRSETFDGEDFEVNHPMLYYIFSIVVL
jgi:hypothetical protein